MRIDQNTPQGLALQKVVQTQLKQYLGADYADDVLPLYIVVMLAHGNEESLVAENLDAFLGGEDAANFATWLFKHLAEHGQKYSVLEPAEPDAEDDGKRQEAREDVPEAEARGSEHQRVETGREHRREAIEWRGGEDGAPRHSRHERAPREEKRRRESGREERHSSHRNGHDAEQGRDEKRLRRDMREQRALEVPREERRRERSRDGDGRRSRAADDGGRLRHERDRADWEREQQRAAERGREWEAQQAWDRDRDRERGRARTVDMGRERGMRERPMYMDREPDWALERERDRERQPLRSRDGPELHMREHHAPAHREPDWRGEQRDRPVRRADETGGNHYSMAEPSPAADANHHTSRDPPSRTARPPEPADQHAARSTVFDRLGQIRARALDQSAAARKSVFDRLRGSKRPAVEDRVDPEAETDDELEQAPAQPAGGLAPKAVAIPKSPALQDGKAEELAEMKRKMEALQEQVQRLQREASTAKGLSAQANPFLPLPGQALQASAPGLAGAAALLGPAVDPRSVHVQGLSPLALPEVVAAHFSGCGRVMEVSIARDMQGLPRGFCHVLFSNELEAQVALSLSGSVLLSQPIMVTPKIIKPAIPMSPGYGFGRGRGFAPGFHGRGAPFSPAPGRGGFGGRGRGRQQTPLASHKYVRPDFKTELERQKSAASVGASLS